MFVDNIFFLFVVIALGVFSHEHEEKRDVNKEYDGPYLMYDVLQSLLKLNEARYETLKKLNNLNSVNYLRTFTKNGYDFTNLLDKFKSIFRFLTFKPNLEIHDPELDYYDVFYDNDYILTIPISSKRKHNVLRTGSEEKVSVRDKKTIDYSSSDEYICGRGRLRCYLACKEAYRRSCTISTPCEYNFLEEMRKSCEEECEYRFE